MKTYLKTIVRMFQKHFMRFLSIIFIVVVSVGLIAGIGSSAEIIDQSLSDYYVRQHVSDFVVKSVDGGFSEEQVARMEKLYGKDAIQLGMSIDVQLTIENTLSDVRLYFLDFANWNINTARIVTGKTAEEISDQAAALCVASQQDRATTSLRQLQCGQKFEIDFASVVRQLSEQAGESLDADTEALFKNLIPQEITVEGTIKDALAFSTEGEPSYLQEDGVEIPEVANALESLNTLDYIFYLPYRVIPTYGDVMLQSGIPDSMIDALLNSIGYEREDGILPQGDLYIALPERDVFDAFSDEYTEYVECEGKAIAQNLGDGVEYIVLKDNYSFHSLHAYADKVLWLSVILMIAFVFVTALVVLSNMTRLMDEERSQIACLRTLGYSGMKTTLKYLLFAMIAMGIGGALAYLVGIGLSAFIYEVFNYNYIMPAMASVASPLFFLVAFCSIVGIAVLATLFTSAKMTGELPASLLRPKPPKSGKKVLLEHISFLWNRLSFKYKSTLRNVLRYLSRFFMTVVSVSCSMGLVLAGLALLDLCLFQNFGSAAIIGLAVVVVIFAGLLTMVVIYTLTNINISERNREIATLMVLGYYDGEVAGYIYREVYINTAVGIVLGYPMGVLLMWLVFTVMNFGSVATVGWAVWVLAPVVVLAFTALVTLILQHKIVGINMNESLKAIE